MSTSYGPLQKVEHPYDSGEAKFIYEAVRGGRVLCRSYLFSFALSPTTDFSKNVAAVAGKANIDGRDFRVKGFAFHYKGFINRMQYTLVPVNRKHSLFFVVKAIRCNKMSFKAHWKMVPVQPGAYACATPEKPGEIANLAKDEVPNSFITFRREGGNFNIYEPGDLVVRRKNGEERNAKVMKVHYHGMGPDPCARESEVFYDINWTDPDEGEGPECVETSLKFRGRW